MMIRLPVPPSVNAMFANRKAPKKGQRGRIITREYLAWLQAAGLSLNCVDPRQRTFGGMKVAVTILLPEKMRGDVDNRIKPVLDLLQKHGVVNNDSQVWDVRARRDDRVGTLALVSVEPFAERAAA